MRNEVRQLTFGILLWIVNALLLVTVYVADANCSLMGYVLPAISGLAEAGVIMGVIVLIAVAVVWRGPERFTSRLVMQVLITLWNQACLLALLVSMIPFYTHK